MPNYDGLSGAGSFTPREKSEASTDGSCLPLLACAIPRTSGLVGGSGTWWESWAGLGAARCGRPGIAGRPRGLWGAQRIVQAPCLALRPTRQGYPAFPCKVSQVRANQDH